MRTVLKISVLAVAALLASGVQAKTMSMPTDQQITATVQHQIDNDPAFAADPIHVTTDHGVVTLSGIVDSRYERHAAKKLACRVVGVKSVDADLGVVNN